MTSTARSIRESQSLEWFAVHTWSRHEKSVFEQLCVKRIETFLPLYDPQTKWKNGKQSGLIPLFPGYLFVRINIQHQLPVLQTSGVARFIGFGRNPAVVPDQEIMQLAAAVEKGNVVEPHPFLVVGRRVRIKRGSLAGLTGILVRDKRGARVVLSVALISRSISIELPDGRE